MISITLYVLAHLRLTLDVFVAKLSITTEIFTIQSTLDDATLLDSQHSTL